MQDILNICTIMRSFAIFIIVASVVVGNQSLQLFQVFHCCACGSSLNLATSYILVKLHI